MLNATEAAELLGLKPRTVYQLAAAGLLACHRMGVGRGAVRLREAYERDTGRLLPREE